MSCDPASNGFKTVGNETDYILGTNGQPVTEVAEDSNGAMNWQRTYVYAGKALIATYNAVPNLQYNAAAYNPANPTVDPPMLAEPSFRLTNWLGSMRVTTNAWGVAQGACAGLPFGDGQDCTGTIPDPHHFTGKERDAESGNDYFGARYYSSGMGRFLSPDWSAKAEPVPYARLDDPQSLNLYSYVRNNPLAKPDLDGHGCPPDCIDLMAIPMMNVGTQQEIANNPIVQGAALLTAAAVAAPEVGASVAAAETVSSVLKAGAALLSVTGVAVNGTSDILGAATHTNVRWNRYGHKCDEPCRCNSRPCNRISQEWVSVSRSGNCR